MMNNVKEIFNDIRENLKDAKYKEEHAILAHNMELINDDKEEILAELLEKKSIINIDLDDIMPFMYNNYLEFISKVTYDSTEYDLLLEHSADTLIASLESNKNLSLLDSQKVIEQLKDDFCIESIKFGITINDELTDNKISLILIGFNKGLIS